MNNKLNEEYFKTREKHNKSSVGYTKYFVWVLLCFIIFFVVNFVIKDKENHRDKERVEMMLEQQTELNKNIQKDNNVIRFHGEKYSIKVLETYSFVELGENAPFIITSSDSSEASVLVQIMPEKINVSDFIIDFRNKVPTYTSVGEVIKRDYKNGNSMETCEVKFKKGNVNYFGTLIIFKKGDKFVLIQGTCAESYWETKADEIYEMIDSFFTLNKDEEKSVLLHG